MPTEFYFQILQFNLDSKIAITITETLNSGKSDSNQCYSESESESATAHCSHSAVFQHRSQPECSPAESKVSIGNIWHWI